MSVADRSGQLRAAVRQLRTQAIDKRQAAECAPEACAACPWRVSNKGKPSPVVDNQAYGWYTQANLRRLWQGVKRGEIMTCHPTDHTMRQANGKFIDQDVQTRECTGSVILQQREMQTLQDVSHHIKVYRQTRRFGLTRIGIETIITRLLYARVPLADVVPMGKPNLNDSDVQYAPLGEWGDGKYK